MNSTVILFVHICIGCLGCIAPTVCTAQCVDKEFPYEFCDGRGHIMTRCSADPHNEYGLMPLRVPEPPCFIPARLYNQVIQVTGLPGPEVIDVFKPEQAVIDMNEAWNEWARLCPSTLGSQPSSAHCCIKIVMSQNDFDFGDPINDIVSKMEYTADHATCRKYCDAPTVYINFTDGFFYQDRRPEVEPQAIAYYTGKRSPRSDYFGLSCDHVFSWRQLIQHVMGNFLGLMSRNAGRSCDDSISVMGNPFTEKDALGLSDDDRCQFLKLYCSDRTAMGN